MQRDDFTCQSCADKETTLNVHHNYYSNGLDPWEYPPEALVTLCETCHKDETETRASAEQNLLRRLREAGMSADHLRELADGIAEGFGRNSYFSDYGSAVFSMAIQNFEQIRPLVEEIWNKHLRARNNEQNS